MTKSSDKLFFVQFPNFGCKKLFPGKAGSVMQNFTWDSSTMPKFRKINDAIPRKCPDKRKDGRKNRRTDRRIEGWTEGWTDPI